MNLGIVTLRQVIAHVGIRNVEPGVKPPTAPRKRNQHLVFGFDFLRFPEALVVLDELLQDRGHRITLFPHEDVLATNEPLALQLLDELKPKNTSE